VKTDRNEELLELRLPLLDAARGNHHNAESSGSSDGSDNGDHAHQGLTQSRWVSDEDPFEHTLSIVFNLQDSCGLVRLWCDHQPGTHRSLTGLMKALLHQLISKELSNLEWLMPNATVNVTHDRWHHCCDLV